MFCINCGKQIVDTARFCNYCGVKVVDFDEKPAQNSAETSENPLQIPVEDVNFSENVENSVDLLKMQSDDPSSATQMNELTEEGDTQFTEKEESDTNEINETLLSGIQSGAIGAQRSADVPTAPSAMQYDENTPQPEPISQIPAQSEQISTTPEQPKQTERRYTLGHIIMCLASTALMAIAAGVFAGLYLSVV